METSHAVMDQAAGPIDQYEAEHSLTCPSIVHLCSVDWERIEAEDKLGCARGVVWAIGLRGSSGYRGSGLLEAPPLPPLGSSPKPTYTLPQRLALGQNPGKMTRQILNGWKQISNHIERGVRTAQRWEALLGMPVHRPALKDRSAVVAFSDELDQWLSRTSPDVRDKCMASHGKEEGSEGFLRVLENMSTLIRQSQQLIRQIRILQEPRRRSRKARPAADRIENACAHRFGARPRLGSVLAFPRRSAAGPWPRKTLLPMRPPRN